VDTILGDVDIDHQRTLTVLDSIGVASGDGPPIPQAKVYTRDGLLLRQTGVFTEVAAQLDAEAEVIGIDQRVVAPFDAADRPLGRAAQRAAADSASLAVYFRHDGTVLVADRVSNMAFTVTAEDGVGPISLFARSADGYVLAFQGVETMRIAWFDSSGTVDRYVSVPAHSYAESNPLTRVAASTEGDVFVLSSTVDGAEVLEVGGSE
ncbi:MAG TPA: hypothetical protein VE569_02175, partial [Acidimicrobiia bacterium]|nr:hypothetical protein [Acidimicrobiia bacterium]